MDEIKTKKCTKCGEEKSLSEFTKDKRSKDGHNGWCRKCTRKASQQWNCINKERSKVNANKRYQEKKKEILKKHKEYYEKHKDEQRKRCKKWTDQHPIETLGYSRKYTSNNRQLIRTRKNQRNAQIRELDPARSAWNHRLASLRPHNYTRAHLSKLFDGHCYISGEGLTGGPDLNTGYCSSAVVLEHNPQTHLFRGWASRRANLNFCKYDSDPEQAIHEAMNFYEADMASRDLPPQYKLVRVEDCKPGDW